MCSNIGYPVVNVLINSASKVQKPQYSISNMRSWAFLYGAVSRHWLSILAESCVKIHRELEWYIAIHEYDDTNTLIDGGKIIEHILNMFNTLRLWQMANISKMTIMFQ